MHALLSDGELALSLKFTAVLAAYARLPEQVPAPLRLRDFRLLIPDDFWEEHFSFGYTKCLGGWVNSEWGEGESFYSLCLGPGQSSYGLHLVTFVSPTNQLSFPEESYGPFYPSLEAEMIRFTLDQPFMQPEVHEGTDIYVFTCA